MIAEPLACTACRFHSLLEQAPSFTGARIHLCTVRHALQDDPDDIDIPDASADPTFLGWYCDLTRRMGELCGPAGKLWSAKP
jgi:hypothetical protein